jgi:DNA-binding winged helix-turn-helix (wHTH) protein
MASRCLRFDRFLVDPDDRQLSRDGLPLDLSPRYLDALTLLARNAGRLVSKEQFLDEVWRGTPVTDEALTQCIKTLRRQLGDDAARPRFIETVPKHGYRFIAHVEQVERPPSSNGGFSAASKDRHPKRREVLLLGGAGTIGGGVAGLAGGLFYGFVGASQPLSPAAGGASVFLVLVSLCMAVALMGGAGVSFGIAAAGLAPTRRWLIAGGALGGLAIGGIVKLLGLDALNLLLGRSPRDITGAVEGLTIGAAVGLALILIGCEAEKPSLRRSIVLTALIGGGAGVLIPLLGGRMMGGSLDSLARTFPQSRLRLDQLGRLFGENGFGTATQIMTGWMEGALFAVCIVVAMTLARGACLRASDNQRIGNAAADAR